METMNINEYSCYDITNKKQNRLLEFQRLKN